MRCGVGMIVALGFSLGLAQAASAADYGPLRGSAYDPPNYRDWSGFYVGGQVGTGGGGANFSVEGNRLVGTVVRESFLATEGVAGWSTTGKGDTGQALQFGAFFGYNTQWDEIVIGIEASYLHTDLSAESSGSLGRYITYDDFRYGVDLSSGSKISLSDFGTIRGRAGYAIDRYLPYVTAGVAVGRASYLTWANVSYDAPTYVGSASPPPATPNAYSAGASEGRGNALIYGWSAGFGVDVALMANVFLRAEYEFVQFSQSKLNLNNARAGLGVKF
jgi:outer membrane immunogenic protein